MVAAEFSVTFAPLTVNVPGVTVPLPMVDVPPLNAISPAPVSEDVPLKMLPVVKVMNALADTVNAPVCAPAAVNAIWPRLTLTLPSLVNGALTTAVPVPDDFVIVPVAMLWKRPGVAQLQVKKAS